MDLPYPVPVSLAAPLALALACNPDARGTTASPVAGSHDARPVHADQTDDAAEASGAQTEVDLGPRRFSIGGATISVVLDEDGMPLPDEIMEAWVRRSATMVSE